MFDSREMGIKDAADSPRYSGGIRDVGVYAK